MPLEAQGHGFAHGHKKIIALPKYSAASLVKLFQADGTRSEDDKKDARTGLGCSGQCAIWYSHAASRTDFWEWIVGSMIYAIYFRGRVHDVFFVCQNKARKNDETLWTHFDGKKHDTSCLGAVSRFWRSLFLCCFDCKPPIIISFSFSCSKKKWRELKFLRCFVSGHVVFRNWRGFWYVMITLIIFIPTKSRYKTHQITKSNTT